MACSCGAPGACACGAYAGGPDPYVGLVPVGVTHRRLSDDVAVGRVAAPAVVVATTGAVVESPGRAPYDPPARGQTRTRFALRRLFYVLDPAAWADPGEAIGHAALPQLGAGKPRGRQAPETRRANIPRPPFGTTAEGVPTPGLEGDWT